MTKRPTPSTTGATERIPMSRVAPGGPGSTDALGWLARAGAIALLLAIGWIAFAALRPLTLVSDAEAPRVRAARAVAPPVLSVAERTTHLNAVTASNWFAPDRMMWTHEDQQALLARSEDAKPKTDGAPSKASSATAIDERPGSIRVTRKEDLPDNLAKAFANLELKGIRSTSDDAMLAMITFVQSKARPATRSFAAGESFTDESFPSEAWKVVLIDAALDRVFLRREGSTVVLPLFGGDSEVVTEAALDGAPEAAVDPGVVGASREEVVAQLRAAGISDEEIAELMRLADADLEPQAPEAAEIEKATEALGDREDLSGIAGVLEMMKSAKPTVREVDTPEDARADSYDNVGRGHAVAGVDAIAGVVTLADGSRWSVSVSDAEKIASWPSDAPISVYQARRIGKPYVIVNDATKAFAGAIHLVEKSTAGAESETDG